MKTIEPKLIWWEGQEIEATVLNAYAGQVNLNVSALFNFSLYSQNENGSLAAQVNGGTLSMYGQDYQDWDQDSFAWDWIATKLGLTITGEYVPPAPTPGPIPTVTP